MYSHIWPDPRAYYQQAISVLDVQGGPTHARSDADDLRREVSIRIAILDAIEGHVPDARTRFGSGEPETDALLLNELGDIAHQDLHDDIVALELLRRAHNLDPKRQDILANLAEVYFATGQYQDFARTASRIDHSPAGREGRVALAALTWAAARLTHTSEGLQAIHFIRVYNDAANGARFNWSWEGTMYALKYGRFRFEEVKPIIDVLELLTKPVTDETRSQLTELLQPQNTSGSPTK